MHLLRIELLAERGEVRNIPEQDGHLPPLAFQAPRVRSGSSLQDGRVRQERTRLAGGRWSRAVLSIPGSGEGASGVASWFPQLRRTCARRQVALQRGHFTSSGVHTARQNRAAEGLSKLHDGHVSDYTIRRPEPIAPSLEIIVPADPRRA